MRVFWTSAAEQDRANILEYISRDNPLAAIRLDEAFAASATQLADHPFMGISSRIPGTRELTPHDNYRLLYEVLNDAVWILALVHAARLWPRR